MTAPDTGVRFTVHDAHAEQARLHALGLEVSAVMTSNGGPPMFTFTDPDHNRFYVVEATPAES
jgi:lactoylglutathione lyase